MEGGSATCQFIHEVYRSEHKQDRRLNAALPVMQRIETLRKIRTNSKAARIPARTPVKGDASASTSTIQYRKEINNSEPLDIFCQNLTK